MKNSEIEQLNERAFSLFPIGSNVRIKGNSCGPNVPANEEGIVTAHGHSVQGDGPKLGVKVPGDMGSALLYNRITSGCCLELL